MILFLVLIYPLIKDRYADKDVDTRPMIEGALPGSITQDAIVYPIVMNWDLAYIITKIENIDYSKWSELDEGMYSFQGDYHTAYIVTHEETRYLVMHMSSIRKFENLITYISMHTSPEVAQKFERAINLNNKL